MLFHSWGRPIFSQSCCHRWLFHQVSRGALHVLACGTVVDPAHPFFFFVIQRKTLRPVLRLLLRGRPSAPTSDFFCYEKGSLRLNPLSKPAWHCRLLINRIGRGVGQKERPPKVMTCKIHIVIRSFDNPFFENYHFGGLTPYTRKIGLPESRVLYTVLRSPHIDKKSREQFSMEIKKEFLVIKTETHELRKKFFRLKRRATRRT